jgi:deoxyribonuclease-1
MNRLFTCLIVTVALLAPFLTNAHSGGLAADGCHLNHSTGVRHCHRNQGEEGSGVSSVDLAGAAVLTFDPSSKSNTKILSFSVAKKKIAKIYENHQITFYCGCRYSGKKPDHSTCGYSPRKDHKRAQRIEWEHIVPASELAKNTPAWYQGHSDCVKSNGRRFKGRKCARKIDETFRLMESDLYNLVPAIGEVNGRRSNYRFGEIKGEPREFGQCDFEVRSKVVEPHPGIRGDIARVYLYMARAYRREFYPPRKIFKMMQKWADSDPSDKWECNRTKLIEQVQGNRNAVTYAACVSSGMGW